MTAAAPFISVVTTLYGSAPYVDEFYARMTSSLLKLTDRFEIIFVNDDPDGTDALEKAIAWQQRDPRVTVIDLSRNFGQHKASMTGLAHAVGDLVFLIEVDLEEAPEWIVPFYESLAAHRDCDVVYGVQGRRKGGIVERITGQAFYSLFNLLSETPIPENHITTRLMTRRYVNALLAFREKALFLGGVFELVGFRQQPLVVNKLSHSATTYTLRKKVVLFVNALTSFSTAPLTLIFWLGVIVSCFSLLFLLLVLVRWTFLSITPGWTSVVASIWAVGGVTILSVGVIGTYVKKILDEVKDRPYTIIRGVYSSRQPPATDQRD